ncbi:hypothetical protein, partial [Micrococcus luteus]|uniref:hypothetical protein n=1 Tax=Micrococcus luteus TaxID=1270 RepID=UPI001C529FDD
MLTSALPIVVGFWTVMFGASILIRKRAVAWATLVVLVSLSAIVSYKFKSTITDLQNQGHDIANLSLDGWTWFALALILVASILHVIFETACQGPLSSAHRRPVFLPAG